jgi:hypothetical protein
MSEIYPDIVEKTFQEESFYIHRRFLPFGRTDITASLIMVWKSTWKNCLIRDDMNTL